MISKMFPVHYASSKAEEEDGVPFEEKMKLLTEELEKQFEEGEKEHVIELYNKLPFLKNTQMFSGSDSEYPED